MKKKAYMKPAMEVIEADLEQLVLTASFDDYNMNKSVQEDEVDDAFSRRSVWDE